MKLILRCQDIKIMFLTLLNLSSISFNLSYKHIYQIDSYIPSLFIGDDNPAFTFTRILEYLLNSEDSEFGLWVNNLKLR